MQRLANDLHGFCARSIYWLGGKIWLNGPSASANDIHIWHLAWPFFASQLCNVQVSIENTSRGYPDKSMHTIYNNTAFTRHAVLDQKLRGHNRQILVPAIQDMLNEIYVLHKINDRDRRCLRVIESNDPTAILASEARDIR